MDINELTRTLALMADVAWPLKYWIGAVVVVMAVLCYYAPVLDYTANPAPVQEDDHP